MWTALVAYGQGANVELTGSFEHGWVPGLLNGVMASGNTSVMELSSGPARALLGFVNGELVRFACVGSDLSREALLRDAGLAADVDRATAAACARERALGSLLELLEWEGGEFRLDPLADPTVEWPGPEGLILYPPIAHDVLMSETARRREERATKPRALLAAALGGEQVVELVRAVMASGNDARIDLRSGERRARLQFYRGELARVARSDQTLTQENVWPAILDLLDWEDVRVLLDAFGEPQPDEQALELERPIALERLERQIARRHEPPAPAAGPPCAAIAIGPDLEVLELLKTQLGERIESTHLTQIPEQGLRRVGHYLARGGRPLVIVDASPSDRPLTPGPQEIIERVARMSPNVRIALVTNDPSEAAGRDVTLLTPPLSDPAPRAALRALLEPFAAEPGDGT